MPTTFGRAARSHQQFRVKSRIVLGFVRMRADRVPDVGVRLGDGADGREAADAVADGHHQADAGRPRPRDHRLAVGVELRRVQVDVAVDQHPAYPIVLSCERVVKTAGSPRQDRGRRRAAFPPQP